MNIDATRPNISRIYDYVLGGHHNFEADRQAARQILKVFPSYPSWARLNRWFLQMVAERWAATGHRCILDLGSGMPTQDHFHIVAPNARVLYTDNDPITVAYAQQVLEGNQAVVYLQADVREPAAILAAADDLFDGVRQVAIGCIGISYFIDDSSLVRLMRALHDWAAPGSVMALSFFYTETEIESNQKVFALFRRHGSEVFPRDEALIRHLCPPWKIHELKPIESWLNLETVSQNGSGEVSTGMMYGTLLEHGG